MKVLIFPDSARGSIHAADIVSGALKHDPDSVLGLATGDTMDGIYRALVARCAAGDISFRRVEAFNLDEYVGLSAEDPASYHHYMRGHLFDHVDIRDEAAHVPAGDAADADAEAARFEKAIAAAGGIDLQLLGIGRNGHVGFNEPSGSLASRTRTVWLSRSTREANAHFFNRLDDVPSSAITLGLGTIREARRIVLCAFGTHKAAAIAAAIEGPVTAMCPASALQLHHDVTFILDDGAAAGLALRDYYDEAAH